MKKKLTPKNLNEDLHLAQVCKKHFPNKHFNTRNNPNYSGNSEAANLIIALEKKKFHDLVV